MDEERQVEHTQRAGHGKERDYARHVEPSAFSGASAIL
jgi:hypothetical protein